MVLTAIMFLLANSVSSILLTFCVKDDLTPIEDPIPLHTTLMLLKAEYATVPVHNNWVFENQRSRLKLLHHTNA